MFFFLVSLALVGGSLQVSIPPLQGHLAYGARPYGDMTISWTTTNTSHPKDYTPIVKWGTSPKHLTNMRHGNSTAQWTCYTLSPHVHGAELSPLSPDTRYYYSFGDEHYGMSDIYDFITAPITGSKDKPTRFAWWGDMGEVHSEHTFERLYTLAKTNGVDFLMHTGDLAYADDRVHESHGTWYEQFEDLFFSKMSNASTYLPTMYGVGNHEHECHYVDYAKRVTVPYKASESPSTFFYSWEYARIHFTMTSSVNADKYCGDYYDPSTAQYKWIERDLAKAYEKRAKGEIDWIIVTAHYPLYCSYLWGPCCFDGCHSTDPRKWNNKWRDNIEPLFTKYEVDLFLNGHTHNWERTLPVRNNVGFPSKDNITFHSPKAPIYLTAGAPGDTEIMGTHFIKPSPQWSAKQITAWSADHKIPYERAGYGFITVYPNKTLHSQFIATLHNTVIDEMWIIKDPSEPAKPEDTDL